MLYEHFLMVMLQYPPDIEDRTHTPDEIRFHALARQKTRGDDNVHMIMKLNNAFILGAASFEPLEFKMKIFAMQGYKWLAGDQKWYEQTQELLIRKIIAPPEWLNCTNQ